MLSGIQKIGYISPQLFRELRRNVMNPRHDQCKSDVYSMGMTLLHAATLRHIAGCYDKARYEINSEKL